jgi:hypothetical protein
MVFLQQAVSGALINCTCVRVCSRSLINRVAERQAAVPLQLVEHTLTASGMLLNKSTVNVTFPHSDVDRCLLPSNNSSHHIIPSLVLRLWLSTDHFYATAATYTSLLDVLHLIRNWFIRNPYEVYFVFLILFK